MHDAAYQFVKANAPKAKHVIDVGGRDINGTVRDCFPKSARYVVVDTMEGANVDVVGDFCDYTPKTKPDVVVCCEVLEHTEAAEAICAHAHKLLGKGGTFIVTAAGPGRAPHSAVDGDALRADEFYANVDPKDLAKWLAAFSDVTVDEAGDDVRAVAVK